MFWQERSEENNFKISDEIIDLSFKIECRTLPLDHAWALSSALIKAAPWLTQTEHTAIHLIHGAESGNGWMRPEDTENELLHLSRRARFTLRLHRNNLEMADELVDLQLATWFGQPSLPPAGQYPDDVSAVVSRIQSLLPEQPEI